jgi:20S proteasome alpha/beta subunit
MSLGIVIKGPEGITLAADSRVTLAAKTPQGLLHVNYDNATKLLSFSEPNNFVGAVTYGQAAIGLRTANSYLTEFEGSLERNRLSVDEFANRLSNFFMEQWRKEMPADYNGPNMTFVVGGFNENEPYGRVFLFEIPQLPEPRLQHDNGFGITWGGQREIVDRLMQGFDERLMQIAANVLTLKDEQLQLLHQALRQELQLPVPIQAMALQDCVDLAVFFLRTTIWAQKLTVGVRGVGGAVDVAIITRQEGFQFVQRKKITAE